MRRSKPIHISIFIFSDIAAAMIVWTIIDLLRRHLLHEEPYTIAGLFSPQSFFPVTIFLVPLFWLVIYSVIGSYNDSVYKKSRLAELTTTFIEVFIGSIILLFVLFLNDKSDDYAYLYTIFFERSEE